MTFRFKFHYAELMYVREMITRVALTFSDLVSAYLLGSLSLVRSPLTDSLLNENLGNISPRFYDATSEVTSLEIDHIFGVIFWTCLIISNFKVFISQVTTP